MEPRGTSPLIDNKALTKIGHLELLSRNTVDGLLMGKHRSTHRGGCCEFTHHRPYTAGDETRLIDWRIYAKRDRYFIKQFEEETNMQAMFVLDASGSMNFGMSTASKFSYARALSACLARLLLRQRDAVGISIVDTTVRQYIPPRTNARHLQAVLDCLRRCEAAGKTRFPAQVKASVSRLQRRGLVVLVSDLFGDTNQLKNALHHVRLRGHDAIVMHVLAPEEIHFQFKQMGRFKSLEDSHRHIDADAASIRNAYLESFQRFQAAVRKATNEAHCDYLQVSTDQDLASVLARYLRLRRSMISRATRATASPSMRGVAR